jgi:hypothetical protein
VVADISGYRSDTGELDFTVEDLVPVLRNLGAKDVRII